MFGRTVLLSMFLLVFSLEAQADMQSGRAAYEAKNYLVALKEFDSAAKAGDKDAQYWLGRIFDAGLGIEKDQDIAFSWFEKAALQHHAEVQRVMGVYYEEGISVGQDFEKAVEWYAESAN